MSDSGDVQSLRPHSIFGPNHRRPACIFTLPARRRRPANASIDCPAWCSHDAQSSDWAISVDDASAARHTACNCTTWHHDDDCDRRVDPACVVAWQKHFAAEAAAEHERKETLYSLGYEELDIFGEELPAENVQPNSTQK